ncbi:hypothetical protein DYB35_006178 [Aphanomyces astaci]|uniref:MABP domain-containing protein n=1 Tax=Aphanomyces astaci TaxID=112090 RepID=A0A3R6X3S2_APHAT|nr:hypothetical protein DYB35_006178 [Aphanomyces astaci]
MRHHLYLHLYLPFPSPFPSIFVSRPFVAGSFIEAVENTADTRDHIRQSFICDLAVVVGAADVPAPLGFTKLNVDLNHTASGPFVFLCYKRGGNRRPVSHVKVVHGLPTAPPQVDGYEVLPVNLNHGTNSSIGIYLCVRRLAADAWRQLSGLALHDLHVSSSRDPGPFVLSQVDLNGGNDGTTPLFLRYKLNPVAGFQIVAAQHIDATLRRSWNATAAIHFEREEARLKQMLAGQLHNTLKYERQDYQARALAAIPLARLHERARANPTPQPTFEIEVLRQLITWFKHEFFSWMNSPACRVRYTRDYDAMLERRTMAREPSLLRILSDLNATKTHAPDRKLVRSFQSSLLALPLALYWPLQDHVSALVVDASGRGRHGINVNCPVQKPVAVKFSRFNTGLQLVPLSPPRSLSSGVSTSTSWTLQWLLRWHDQAVEALGPPNVALSTPFLHLSPSPDQPLLFHVAYTDALTLEWLGPPDTTAAGSTASDSLAVDTTYHMALVSASGVVTCFVNGVAVFETRPLTSNPILLDSFEFAVAPSPRSSVLPLLSHVALVTRALSAEELHALARAAVPSPRLVAGGADDFVDLSVTCLESMSVTTNFGRSLTAGGTGGGPFDVFIPAGYMARAFSFDIGDHVNQPVVFSLTWVVVVRYLTNLADKPDNETFHKIKATNSYFQKNVAPLGGHLDAVFDACGFDRVEEDGGDVFFVYRKHAAPPHAVRRALYDIATFLAVEK